MMPLPFFLPLVSPSMQHCSVFLIFDHGHSLFICLVFNSFTFPSTHLCRLFFQGLYAIDGIESALRKMQVCVVHPRNDFKPLEVEVTRCERNSNQFTQKNKNGRWVDVYQLASSDFQTQLQKENFIFPFFYCLIYYQRNLSLWADDMTLQLKDLLSEPVSRSPDPKKSNKCWIGPPIISASRSRRDTM